MIRAVRSVVALVLGGALACAPMIGVAAEEPMVPGEELQIASLTGEIIGTSGTVLTTDESLRVTVEMVNESESSMDGELVHLRVTESALTSHESIEDFLASPSSYARRTVATRPLGGIDGLASGTESVMTLVAPADTLDLPSKRSGVYGLTVTVIGSDGAVTVDSLVFTWAPVDIPDLQVAAVALGTSSQTRAAAVVANSDLDGVSLLLDPTVSEGLSVGGHEVYRTLAGDADVTSLARADGLALLSFAEGDANESAPHYPAAATLIPSVAVADQATLDAADQIGATAVILESRFDIEGVTGGGDAAVVDVETSEGTLPVVRPDAALSSVLASYRPGTVAAASRIVAEAAISASSSKDGLVVVAPGQSWTLADTEASTVLRALLEAPWVTSVPLTTALAGEHPTGTAADPETGTEDDLAAESVGTLTDAMEDVSLVASAAVEPGALLEQYALGLLRAASMESRARTATRDSLVERSLLTAQEAIDGISIATSADLNFIAEEGSLPITVRNTIDQDVTVVVSARSSSPNLRFTGRPEETVPAGSEVVLQIPVTAVSSANVDVTVVVRTPTGEVLSEAQTLTVRVRADWGNAATLVFSVMLALLLVAGVVRTVRRGRRDTRVGPGELAPSAESGGTPDEPAEAPGSQDDGVASDAQHGATDSERGAGDGGEAPVDEDASGPPTRDNA